MEERGNKRTVFFVVVVCVCLFSFVKNFFLLFLFLLIMPQKKYTKAKRGGGKGENGVSSLSEMGPLEGAMNSKEGEKLMKILSDSPHQFLNRDESLITVLFFVFCFFVSVSLCFLFFVFCFLFFCFLFLCFMFYVFCFMFYVFCFLFFVPSFLSSLFLTFRFLVVEWLCEDLI